jgi:hypothetical protein
MKKIVIDDHFIALKLVEGLFRKGLINPETFENVKTTYPEVFAASGETYWEQQLNHNVKDGK